MIIAVAVYLNLVFTVEPLSSDGGLSAWYFAQDRARQVYTQAGSLTQSTVPERYGQLQGFVVDIFNDSDWTQTIVGPDPVMEQTTEWQPTLAVGSGWDIEYPRDAWRLRNLGITSATATIRFGKIPQQIPCQSIFIG